MTTYLKPSQFKHRYGINPNTMRNYIKFGMPNRVEKGGHISYPEQECLEWIANRRQAHPPAHQARIKPPKGTVTVEWLCQNCQTSKQTIRHWITESNAPEHHTSPGNLSQDLIYFYPAELHEWMQRYVKNAHSATQAECRQRWLTALEAAFPELIENTNKTETTPTMTNNTPTQKPAETNAIKPQFKNYDPCRTYQTGDEIQVVLCNGRSNGIAASLMLLTGTVLKNENAVGIVLCSVNGNPEQIPASNLRLLRAIEDIPQYAVFHKDDTYFVTPKTEREAIAMFYHGKNSPLTVEDARNLAELTLESIKEKK